MYLSYCKHRISEKCCVLVNMLNLCSILYNLRKKQCALPKVNTERFMTSYVYRLIFKHRIR